MAMNQSSIITFEIKLVIKFIAIVGGGALQSQASQAPSLQPVISEQVNSIQFNSIQFNSMYAFFSILIPSHIYFPEKSRREESLDNLKA